MRQLFFSAHGRIGRKSFWTGFAIIVGSTVLLSIATFFLAGTWEWSSDTEQYDLVPRPAGIVVSSLLWVVCLVAAIWASICLGIKRFHDRGKPGVWVLIQFVPFIGGIWYIVECGFLPGTAGPNLYGADRAAMLPHPAVAA